MKRLGSCGRRRGVPMAPVGLGLAALLLVASSTLAHAEGELKTYQTKYYVLHTDLDEHGVREVTQRITLMAEEYHQRTKGLGRTVAERLPFFMFREAADYYAAGGMPGSAGVYMGVGLMAIADPRLEDIVWHIVQHEGFHQFVDASIGRGIPIWANEGMAEYFGEGIWTGDGFVVGLIPRERLKRVQASIVDGWFQTLRAMMLTSHQLWNTELSGANYDQAWSMVHFLAHADNGKYEQAFMGFLRDVSQGVEWERAWRRHLGDDVDAFQRRWEQWWRGLPENPTADLQAQAVAEALASFYARALSQRQKFETVEEFFGAAEAGELKCDAQDWLPPKLLEWALKKAPEAGRWSIEKRKSGWPMLVCETAGGARLESRFKASNGRVRDVSVEQKKAQRR